MTIDNLHDVMIICFAVIAAKAGKLFLNFFRDSSVCSPRRVEQYSAVQTTGDQLSYFFTSKLKL